MDGFVAVELLYSVEHKALQLCIFVVRTSTHLSGVLPDAAMF